MHMNANIHRGIHIYFYIHIYTYIKTVPSSDRALYTCISLIRYTYTDTYIQISPTVSGSNQMKVETWE